MKVKTIAEAWNKAGQIFPTDYELDEHLTRRAGHKIYSSTVKDGSYNNYWISDLGDRLEVNAGANSTNIWIEEEEADIVPLMFTRDELEIIRKALLHYSIKEDKKASKEWEYENKGLALKHEAKAEVADELRHKILKELEA